MMGEVIQEYLVALGAQVDKPGFQELDRTINETTGVIQRATNSWISQFTKAAGIVASAIAGVTASAAGLMNEAANQDLAMQKYARNMMMTRDAAERLKRTTDALGESFNDILLTPELLAGFRQLSAEGRQMQIGGDFSETMKNFRDLTFEFNRLKQEASYAMTWVGFYLMGTSKFQRFVQIIFIN